MPHTLADLLEGSDVRIANDAATVTGIAADSREVRPGDAFFALPGTRAHGESFAAGAAEKGAAIVVTDRPPSAALDVPVVVVPDVRAAFARAAARLYAPQPETVVAVTGTSGKTSVASFVRQIWAACGIRGASVGTLGVETDTGLVPGALTTPDPLSLHMALKGLKSEGVDHVAMEASSHGLDQRRLDGIRFKAVGFTNLTRDHLDYHLDMQAYGGAKLRLFKELLADGGFAVVNADDPEHMPFLFAGLDRGATVMSVGREGGWYEIGDISPEGFGQHVTGRLVGEPADFHLPLAGAFQVSNALVALGLAIATGAPQARALEALGSLRGARGRLELVGRHKGGAIFVDYSHKPEALRQALLTLRPFAKGRLVVVFGCGGDRDKGKRPEMGAIAANLADAVVVTDDNPRTEDAASIRRAILAAAPGAREIGDRAEAIGTAIAEMGPGDVVLVAGKGHEDYQIVGTAKHHFSDHEVVAEALKGR